MKKVFFWSFLWIFGLGSCHQDEGCCDYLDQEYFGKWLLVERGYSPGAGYITEPIAPQAGLFIEMLPGGRFNSNIEGLKDRHFYAILDNPQDDRPVLALFKDQQEFTDDLDQLEHSYNAANDDNELTLSFRFCIEGCHLKFINTDQ